MNTPFFQSFLAPYLHQFVQYKRALNRKYLNDAHTLRLFDRYLCNHDIADWHSVIQKPQCTPEPVQPIQEGETEEEATERQQETERLRREHEQEQERKADSEEVGRSLTRRREAEQRSPALFPTTAISTNQKENTVMSTLAVSPSTAAISLYFREGSSDKVYHAQIAPDGNDLYSVNFQYGRRGSTLQTGTKTAAPVALAQARKIFDKLVAEKRAKGYTEGESGVPYSGGELANRRFEYTPQLLNSIDEAAMLEYLRNPDWLMQEKMDGVRLIVVRRGNSVTAGNRNGLTVAVSAAIVEAVLALDHDCVLDGEAIGDVYWPFDLLSLDGNDITHRSLTYRLQLLTAILRARPVESHRPRRTAFSERDKRALLNTIRAERGEGVVFKNAHARYNTGTARLRRRCPEAQIQGKRELRRPLP
jgi:bifunctional non-homologous end joining protein LigD